jgi:hypothetical protein
MWLKGYNPDPALAQPALVDAIRREVASVIRWRLALHAKKPLITQESEPGNGKVARVYRADAEQRFPPDFGRAIRVFKLAPVAWGI